MGSRLPDWVPYCGAAPDPGALLHRWNLDPMLLLVLLCLAAAIHHFRAHLRVQLAIAALGVLFFLYVSPFCALGSALFTVRVVHDLVLAVLLAPLTVFAIRPELRFIKGSLPVWTCLHALTFWLWHAPALYRAAMSSDAAFWTMQVTIAGTAVIWWTKVLRAEALAAAGALLATMVAMGALGALLTFLPRALYAPHWLTTQAWGWSPLEDQQIAGIMMWAPGSAVYLLAALAILYRTLGARAPA